MRQHPSLSVSSQHKGFSLVEFMVTAFILSIGLLGLGALQIMATRGGTNSKSRDAAAYLANSILDRLKADGQITANQRANNLALSGTALLANAALDVANPYSSPNSANVLQTRFNFRGGPIEPTSTFDDEKLPVFSATYVVRSNAKDGDPLGSSLQMSREVVVNVTWQESVPQGATSILVTKSLSMSRYIRF